MAKQKVALIRPFKLQDKLNGKKIEIKVTPHYSVLSAVIPAIPVSRI